MVFKTCMRGLIAAAALTVAVAPGRAQSVPRIAETASIELAIPSDSLSHIFSFC